MDKDQKFWLLLWTIFGATAVLITAVSVWGYTDRHNKAIAAGYVEKPDTVQSTHWEKP